MEEVLNRGNCVVCTKAADLACQRCGDFYCSSKCQRKDWQSHRYICTPMPALVHPKSFSIYSEGNKSEAPVAIVENIPEAKKLTRSENDADKLKANVENIKVSQVTPPNSMLTQTSRPASISDKAEDLKNEQKNNDNNDHNVVVSSNIIQKIKYKSPPNMPMPANNSVVYIAGFRSPNRCFIRDASPEADEAYSKILETVDRLGKGLPNIRPKHHQYVLSTYNGNLQRAKVLSANDNNSRLLFVDQGVIKGRNLCTITEMSDEIMALPCYAIQVQLQGVANYAISDEINKLLTTFENEKFVIAYANNNNNPNHIELELFHADTKKSLNRQINEYCADKQLFDLNEPKAQLKNKVGNVSPINKVVQKDVNIAKVNDNDDTIAKIEASLPVLQDKQKESQKTEITKESELVLEEITEAKMAAIHNNDEVNKKEIKVIPETIPLKEKPLSLNGITQTKEKPIINAPFESVCFKGNPKDGLDVFIVDNSNIRRGVFGALDSAHAREFAELQTLLSEFDDPQPYEPELKEYVMVKSDGVWNRAKVTHIDPPYYKVMFLEFVYSEKVTMNDIRRYPIEITIPCFTNMCFIAEMPNQLNEAQIAHLMQTFKVHSLVHIDSVTYLHNIAEVRCKKLLEELDKLKDK